jgi:hypothetical protein
MKHINRTTFLNLLLCLICLMPVSSAWSADEDMISQVYLEFDPETGEFKTALDPMAQQKNQHMQAQQIQEIQQAQENLANQQVGSGQQATPVAAAPIDQQSSIAASGDSAGGGNNMMLVGGIIILLVIVGAVVMMRKGQQTA